MPSAHDAAELFSSPAWYKALSLRERASGRRAAGTRSPMPGDAEMAARAARRLARWQAQEPFSQDGFFARRLASEALGVEELRELLGETPEEVAERAAPAGRPVWLEEIESAFTATPSQRFPLSPDLLDGSPQIGFLEAVRPLLDAGYGRLVAGLREVSGQARERIAPLLARQIPLHLLLLTGRTMVLELHLAGQAGQLSGETPEERFESFVERLRDPAAALALLHQYPVLARQVVETIGRWVSYSLEIIGHLAADRARLREAFSPGRDLGQLSEVRTGLGDGHRGGRTVALLGFDSGVELIYKPRPIAVEAAFQDLLEWVCARGFGPALACLRLVDAGDHGWAEVVKAAPCKNGAELERFYLRQGGYLALLYLLSGTDMHHENVIAAGEYPILVDLEALFHPINQSLGRTPSSTVLPDTVLRVGFLPVMDDGGLAGGEGVDLSGLAAAEGQMLPRPVLRAERSGTDEMRFERRRIAAPIGEHRPTLDGSEVAVASYAGAVASGFRRMCGLLAAHRSELLSADGPLTAFAAAPVRVVVRLTLAYSGLFVDGQHPYVLGDAMDRDRLFDHLWGVVPECPALERLVPAEHRDLVNGDIPLFTTRPGSTDVWSSDGERFASFLEGTGLERVRERLRSLDEAEIERQAWLVRNSLAAGGEAETDSYELRPAAPPTRDELLAAAAAVGRRLEALAFPSGETACWYGPDFRGGRWVLGPAGPDLHLGMAGIVLFLAHLAAATGERRFDRLARAATATLRDQVAPGSTRLETTIGAFSGWGGVLYAFTHLGCLWGDESLLDEAERAAERLAPGIEGDPSCDVVAGAAGALVCLLGLQRVRPAERLLDLAVRCGERILARARPMQRGLGWPNELAGPTPLAGFSHGAAGISWALLHLAAASGDDRYRRAALAALEYERSLYDPAEENWPDLRVRTGKQQAAAPQTRHFMCAWCHGAAGIAIGRLDSWHLVEEAARSEMREECAVALRTTLATGFGKGHCLCHGDLGNLEALTLGAEKLGDPVLAESAGRLAGGILEDIRRHGWRMGVPSAAEVPGLMMGLAGIGYGLLRLAAPRRVPSVLWLAPPLIA